MFPVIRSFVISQSDNYEASLSVWQQKYDDNYCIVLDAPGVQLYIHDVTRETVLGLAEELVEKFSKEGESNASSD